LDIPLKTTELLKRVRYHLEKGTYIVSAHALQRQNERLVSLEDVLYVLKTGVREEKKDLFDVKRQMWKYAIYGKTKDEIKLRVIISFEEEMILITVMRVK
jgi:hypothetical protein